VADPKKANRPSKPTARELLVGSQLKPRTVPKGMTGDVSLLDLYLALNHSTVNIESAVTDATIEMTMEGASTLTVTVIDRDWKLLRSGRLSSRNDVEIDGLFFRLKGVRMSGNSNLELTFEDREVAVMRIYNKPIKQSESTARGQLTRAEFILRMLKEIVEVPIVYYIPELHKKQPIDGAAQLATPATQYPADKKADMGIPKENTLKVKTAKMTEEQRKNANIILNTGMSYPVDRKFLVMAAMCVIVESTFHNLQAFESPDLSSMGLSNPVGCFQQVMWMHGKRSQWPASRDVARDAGAQAATDKDGRSGFYEQLLKQYNAYPNLSYGELIDKVQVSGAASTYAFYREQAERIVTAFGAGAGDGSDNSQYLATVGQIDYEFYRGLPPTGKLRKQKYGGKWGPESTWDCIRRLADEVNWFAFFSEGIFYFMSDKDIFKQKPAAVIDHSSAGVDEISGDYDEGKKTATLSITARVGRWAAAPGSIVQVINMGPWNGKWLVNDVSRSLFSSQANITLKKPLPRLPEPSETNIIDTSGDSVYDYNPGTSKAGSADAPRGGMVKLAGDLLIQHTLGNWIDVNGQGLDQIRKTANGQMVSSALGHDVYIQADVIRVVLWLISQGYKIGTYAWCSDHHNDGAHGHSGGWAVDIEEINGHHVAENTPQCGKLTYEVAKLIHDANPPIYPRQLITAGYGNRQYSKFVALCLPGGNGYYDPGTLADHTNHIHVGYGERKKGGEFVW